MLPGETVLSGCDLATTDDFQVMSSAAGYYVGTMDKTCGGPCTRETSYMSQEEAEFSLKTFKEHGYLPGMR